MTAFAAAVTGFGMVSPAGVGVTGSWRAILDGVPAARRIPEMAGLPVQIGCRVPDFDPGELPRGGRQYDRYTQFAVAAAREALERAGLSGHEWADSSRVAVIIGSGAGGTGTFEEQFRALIADGPNEVSPLTLPMGLINMAAGEVAIDLAAQGPCLAPVTACASGATALGIGRDLLRLGVVDVVVAGGAEAPITPLYASAFARMRTLSRNPDPETASRPFDAARDGFVLGEGAAVFVLEAEEHARARGAEVLGRIIGYGASADAHHVTSPHPEGRGAESALRAALSDAGLDGSEIGYVNAHGTSTRMNDVVEAGVIRRVCGAEVPVSSIKGVTGHALGASAAIEAAATLLAIRDGVVPPTAGLADPDPLIDLDLVSKAPRTGRVDLAVSNSFGFGGQNAVLVLASA